MLILLSLKCFETFYFRELRLQMLIIDSFVPIEYQELIGTYTQLLHALSVVAFFNLFWFGLANIGNLLTTTFLRREPCPVE